MGLNLSNRQIAQKLELNKDDVQHMTTHLRQGLVDQKVPVSLHGEVECDEVYIVAGHKGHPTAVKKRTKRTTQSTQRRSGTWHLSRGKTADFRYDPTRGACGHSDAGECPAKNHRAVIKKGIALDTLIYTDEYNIYGPAGSLGRCVG